MNAAAESYKWSVFYPVICVAAAGCWLWWLPNASDMFPNEITTRILDYTLPLAWFCMVLPVVGIVGAVRDAIRMRRLPGHASTRSLVSSVLGFVYLGGVMLLAVSCMPDGYELANGWDPHWFHLLCVCSAVAGALLVWRSVYVYRSVRRRGTWQ